MFDCVFLDFYYVSLFTAVFKRTFPYLQTDTPRTLPFIHKSMFMTKVTFSESILQSNKTLQVVINVHRAHSYSY